MSAFKLVGIAYGIFLLVGAGMGWKAGSNVSLIMGLVSGALVLLSVYLSGTQFTLGCGMLTGVSGLLSVVFLIRLLKTQKMMPSGMLLLLSALVLIFCIVELLKHK